MSTEQQEQIRTTVKQWVAEAIALRAGAHLPDTAVVSPQQLRDALVDCRGRLDRVDELLVSATRLKATEQRDAVRCRAYYETQWDQAAQRVPAVEYASARERLAQVNLFVVADARAARVADEAVSYATEGYDVLRTIQRGLDGLRMDIHRMLTAITFESGLER
jgi:hypothetical protein